MSERINSVDLASEALEFVAPDLVAFYGEKNAIVALRIAQTAMAVFHPDYIRTTDTAGDTAGSSDFSEINQLIMQFELDPSHAEALYEDSKTLSIERVDSLRDNLRMQKHLSDAHSDVLYCNEQISYVGGDSLNAIVSTGEKEVGDLEILSLVLGNRVIEHLLSINPIDRAFAINKLRKPIHKLSSSSPMSFSSSEWNRVLDYLSDTQNDLELHNLEADNLPEILLATVRERSTTMLSMLLRDLSPKESKVYPANWYRSFTGIVVVPIDQETWPQYNSIYEGLTPEIGSIREVIVKNGVIVQTSEIDPANRLSIKLVKELPNVTKTWINELISKTAKSIGYEDFVYEFSDGTQAPMDFIFKVDDTGTATVLYTRPTALDNIPSGAIRFQMDLSGDFMPVRPGYYHIKAGRNPLTKKYAKVDCPLALIELEKTSRPAAAKKYVGSTLIAGVEVTTVEIDEGFDVRMSPIDTPENAANYISLPYGKTVSIGSTKATKLLSGVLHNQKDLNIGNVLEIKDSACATGVNYILILGAKGDVHVSNGLANSRIRLIKGESEQ